MPDVDAIIVPVGGGGLIAGIGTAVKALKPQVQIIGVEPVNAPTLQASLKAATGRRASTPSPRSPTAWPSRKSASSAST